MSVDVSLRLDEEVYTVNEDDGTVEICVEKVGQTTDDITVSLVIRETSPASAEGRIS